jgi:hypothetical protein
MKKSPAYTHIDRLKIVAMWVQKRGYSVVRKKSRSPPHNAVAL